jgi:hypothetical protein
MKELCQPLPLYFRSESKVKSNIKFNAFSTKISQLGQLGYHKGHLTLDQSSYTLEFVSDKLSTSLDIFEVRKFLVSQDASRMKKPYPKDFLFEASILTLPKGRFDIVVPDYKVFSKVKEGVSAILSVKDFISKFRN